MTATQLLRKTHSPAQQTNRKQVHCDSYSVHQQHYEAVVVVVTVFSVAPTAAVAAGAVAAV